MSELLEAVFVMLAALVGLMLFAAIGIYSYDSVGWVIIWGIVILQISYVVFLPIGCIGLASEDGKKAGELAGIFVVGVIMVFIYSYIVDDFTLYLAGFWRVGINSFCLKIISFPSHAMHATAQYFAALWHALSGYPADKVHVAQPAHAQIKVNETNLRVVLIDWIGSSLWNIVLGVISSFVAAGLLLLWRRGNG